MISRKTALFIANVVANNFVHECMENYNGGRNHKYVKRVSAERLRDFLFEYEVRGFSIEKMCKSFHTQQDLKEDVMNMHTGIFYNGTNYTK